MVTLFDNKIDRLEWHTTFACCAIRALEKFLYEKDIMTDKDIQRLREQISDDLSADIESGVVTMTNEEVIKILQSCSTSLRVVIAALKDCGFENVAARVASVREKLDMVTQKLGGEISKGV